eukprot:CAMPEP_0168324272 /NCGR_PEP_ID=MMETSP0213-20121227/3987_1 /TAXON_ID=151035 /ORGANISM="Euplotes harpa, Strain FSP1.4" /LENGTH=92 /DNA_ID=CAMNT_0008326521 /DNA_START=361 /DNA_END=639 /DNA_ORIENTATION=-
MALNCETEWAKSVPRQRVSSSLNDNCSWPVVVSDIAGNDFEQVYVHVVGHPAFERHVHREVLADLLTRILDAPRAREEITEFVKRQRHHPVC